MTTTKQQTTKAFTRKEKNTVFTQRITRLCDSNVTPAPEEFLGSIDYYKDDNKKDLKK